MISHSIITISHMAIEVDIHDRFTWGILSYLSFSSNVISHLAITVTFMTNSVGESRHVGHSIKKKCDFTFNIYDYLHDEFSW